jgi:hypothetical protein
MSPLAAPSALSCRGARSARLLYRLDYGGHINCLQRCIQEPMDHLGTALRLGPSVTRIPEVHFGVGIGLPTMESVQ